MAVPLEIAPIDVVNEALEQLGKTPIDDLDDADDPVAVTCKRYYGSILRTMLRDHTWNFARARIGLAVSATTPISGYAYQYALPVDCYRVIRLNGSDTIPWRIEERFLLTDESSAIIEYIKWVDDPNIWDGAFHQAFMTYMAVRLAPAFSVDVAKASDLYRLYVMQIADAKAVDGQESSPERMEFTELTDDIRE